MSFNSRSFCHPFPLFFLIFCFSVSFFLFLCILDIFKTIIYITFQLLAVFLFVVCLFISAYCDVAQLGIFFINNMKTVDCFYFHKDTDTHLCNQNVTINVVYFQSSKCAIL